MAEPPPPPHHHQQGTPAAGWHEDMLACVAALEQALLPCLPARELQAVDRSLQPSHQSLMLRGTRGISWRLPRSSSLTSSACSARTDRPQKRCFGRLRCGLT
ncbi:hypothetical protein ACP4OV_006918 [Aristida adscensionis]